MAHGYQPQTVNGQPVTNYKEKFLYSAALIGSAQSVEATAFTYARGERVAGANNESVNADFRHTNSEDKGQMSPTDWMDIVTISIEMPVDITVTPMSQCMDRLYMKVKTNGPNEMLGGLSRHFPAGNGLLAFSNANGVAYFNNGNLDPMSRTRLSVPIRLASGLSYKATLENQGGAFATAAIDTIVRIMYRGAGPTGVAGG
jgi:hypothetical protein